MACRRLHIDRVHLFHTVVRIPRNTFATPGSLRGSRVGHIPLGEKSLDVRAARARVLGMRALNIGICSLQRACTHEPRHSDAKGDCIDDCDSFSYLCSETARRMVCMLNENINKKLSYSIAIRTARALRSSIVERGKRAYDKV